MIDAVNAQNDEDEPAMLDSVDGQWCEYYGDYVVANLVNMAVKRARTEGPTEDQGKDEKTTRP